MKVISESRCISPEYAQEVINECRFPNQRSLSEYKLKEYLASMSSGEWIAGSTLSFGSVEGKDIRYLLNGQHRLTAVARTGKAQEFNVKEYTFAPDEPYMDVMKAIYATEDTGAKRTVSDMISAYELAGEFGLSKEYLRRALASVVMLERSFSPRKDRGPLPVHDQIRLLREWQGPMSMAATFLLGRGSKNSNFVSSPVLAVMLATLKHQPEMAVPFWKSICENDGLLKGTAAHSLHAYITERKVRMEGESTFVRKVAHGWNAFYEGRSPGYFLIRDTDQPVKILGTPYR